jgi:RNA-directed DNA polymerase
MSLWEKLKEWWRNLTAGAGMDVPELARRLDWHQIELELTQPTYQEQRIPKRSGGERILTVPDEGLKRLQRRILRRLLGKLRAHPQAMGFERRHSIVTHARVHQGQAVLLKIDLRNFFLCTTQKRLYRYFRFIGWNRHAAKLLLKLTTWHGGLPQGAPTSPRLSNLVNYQLDTRLTRLAETFQARYSRYADDLTFSLGQDDRKVLNYLLRKTKRILGEYGYSLNRKKVRILRQHQRQIVTGLVVNEKVQLPRTTRRWLRAVAHHLRTGRPATLSPQQLAGWQALQQMVTRQGTPPPPNP